MTGFNGLTGPKGDIIPFQIPTDFRGFVVYSNGTTDISACQFKLIHKNINTTSPIRYNTDVEVKYEEEREFCLAIYIFKSTNFLI